MLCNSRERSPVYASACSSRTGLSVLPEPGKVAPRLWAVGRAAASRLRTKKIVFKRDRSRD
ncbi:MAG: hypothetical protein ACREPR_06030 [Brasilonema sp.]